MQAAPQVTGPILVYAGVGPHQAWRFLGTGREAPRWRFEYGFVPFFNDFGGPRIPFDEVFASQQAMVSMDLNFFRQDTLNAVESVPNSFGAPMVNLFGDVGSMMLTERKAYPLALVFPFSAKPTYKANGLPAGIRFFNAFIIGPSGHRSGTVPHEINLIWRCKASFNIKTLAFQLGDYNIAGLPPAA